MIRDSQLMFCENQNFGGTAAAIDDVAQTSTNVIDMGSENHHAFTSTPIYLCYHITEGPSPISTLATAQDQSRTREGIYNVTMNVTASKLNPPSSGSMDTHGTGDPGAYFSSNVTTQHTTWIQAHTNDMFRISLQPFHANLSNPLGRYWQLRVAVTVPGADNPSLACSLRMSAWIAGPHEAQHIADYPRDGGAAGRFIS